MATKKIKSRQTTTAAPVDKARSLWLAGLGAVSIAQKQGGDLYAGLIVEGKDFQARTRKLAREIGTDTKAQVKGVIAPLRARFKSNTKKAGATIQRGVALALAQLGIPSKADVEELTQRVAALSRQLKTAK
ncbi:MAG: phasin family protein [Rudaea sp.]|nr:phasin family protein [Rudaea sp.]